MDPVVFFELWLVMFFEDPRSERRLTWAVADSASRCAGTSATICTSPCPNTLQFEPHPRAVRPGNLHRRFFERIVEMCFEAGLVRGREPCFDDAKSKPMPRWTPRRGRARSWRAPDRAAQERAPEERQVAGPHVREARCRKRRPQPKHATVLAFTQVAAEALGISP